MHSVCLDAERQLADGDVRVKAGRSAWSAPKGFGHWLDLGQRLLRGGTDERLSPHLMRDIGVSCVDLVALKD